MIEMVSFSDSLSRYPPFPFLISRFFSHLASLFANLMVVVTIFGQLTKTYRHFWPFGVSFMFKENKGLLPFLRHDSFQPW